VDTNLVMWGLVVGFFMPILISVVQQPSWSQSVRSVVMFAASAIAGFGTAWFEGRLNGVDITTAILIVMVTTIATYKGFWQPNGVSPKIEVATSPKKDVPNA
jgi:hypothetical protein